MDKTCIIIGASHAGGQVAISLRQAGWEGKIILIGDEDYLPYHRPPLSKDFLSGGKDLDPKLLSAPQATYEMANVECMMGQRVTKINPQDKTIMLDKGQNLAYDKLVLCTGARPRESSRLKGQTSLMCFTCEMRDDVLAIKAKVVAGKKAVIIGGGYIGLETAASLRKQDMQVSVLEMESRILQRVTAPLMSEFYKRVHTEEGVEIAENCVAQKIVATDEGLSVMASSGEIFRGYGHCWHRGYSQCGTGRSRRLEVGNGIVVDEFCQTSDPDIYAAGDVTWHYNGVYDQHLRLESVPNATDQAKIIAGVLVGKDKPYNSLPWFWSDQYDLKLQIAGLSGGYDDVVLAWGSKCGTKLCGVLF